MINRVDSFLGVDYKVINWGGFTRVDFSLATNYSFSVSSVYKIVDQVYLHVKSLEEALKQ